MMLNRVPSPVRRRGLSLAEVVVSTFLIGLLMTAALTGVGAAARSTNASSNDADSFALARALLEEVVPLPYEDPNQTPSFGVESGETANPNARSGFDDVDDYKDRADTPPKDRNGNALAGYTGWQRTADVEKVDPSDHSLRSDGSSDKGLRLITVTVRDPSGRQRTLQAYRSNIGGCLQSQGVGQTLVTWVGISLQSGPGAAINSGVSLSNHAADQ